MNKSNANNRIGIIGASSLVGICLLQRLTKAGWQITAYSRRSNSRTVVHGVNWKKLPSLDSPSHEDEENIPLWFCVAPIWTLPEHFSLLASYGVRHVVALSSTSLFSKSNSIDPGEQALALRLADAELSVQNWAECHEIQWEILRPTLIYGLGQDKNIAEIARFIQRFGFFPLFGRANGLRQPIHVEDVTSACVAAMFAPSTVGNRAFNISGSETLPYSEMITRIFTALGRPPRLITVPRWVFNIAVQILHIIPRYRQWSTSMAERMNKDLVFDHSEAERNLDFKPRTFMLAAEDLPT